MHRSGLAEMTSRSSYKLQRGREESEQKALMKNKCDFLF